MFARVMSAAVVGMEAVPVEVEVELLSGCLPSFTIVGLPDKAVQESKERVIAAVRKVVGKWPWHKITVNLAPADLPKAGSGFDLPIALGILASSGEIKLPENSMCVGELNLAGDIKGVPGVLAVAELTKEGKYSRLVIPRANEMEARLSGVEWVSTDRLGDLVKLLNNGKWLIQNGCTGRNVETMTLEARTRQRDRLIALSGKKAVQYECDFSMVRGQAVAKRALEIAAAGGHNLLMVGPPGSGKTMLANAFPSILPPLNEDEALEVTKIYSIAGKLPRGAGLIEARPFRKPHHTASISAIVGGGTLPRPGEITLAHRGVLFLDEFGEFPKSMLDALRQPMEDGTVTVSRAAGIVTFPSRFLLLAAMNPCPCGYLNDPKHKCNCSQAQLQIYQRKLSGPILDRIDLVVRVDRPTKEELEGVETSNAPVTSSTEVRTRVARAFSKTGWKIDDMKTLETLVVPEAKRALTSAVNRYAISARGYCKILRTARTISVLGGSRQIETKHISEALNFRGEKIDNK